MSELSISVPLILGGKSTSGEVFLERAVTEAISRSGARIVCKQSLAPGDVIKFLLADQEHQCMARVINAGPRKGLHQQFMLEMDAETLPFWSLLYLAAQCVAPSSASALALQAPAEKVLAAESGADEIQEAVEEALDRRMDHVMASLEQRLPAPANAPWPGAEAQAAAFEARIAEAMERMWQELGRRFTTAGITYERHMKEVAEAGVQEFKARVKSAIERG